MTLLYTSKENSEPKKLTKEFFSNNQFSFIWFVFVKNSEFGAKLSSQYLISTTFNARDKSIHLKKTFIRGQRFSPTKPKEKIESK